ncbi:TraB/GumN family protein [Aureimonas ureilytica]|uniref:TraB/GumN family protein n=1 Tax=Aureimonas ureilytica TaxID=401562 RepID=UPI0003719FA5|nr:TraB/GumN family protein [Aureimonas ureilytica]
MPPRFLSRLLAPGLLVALLGAPAFAQTPAPAACAPGTSALPALERSGQLAEAEAEAANVPNGEGKLFRVERAGVAPSFLFGTMHLTDPRVLTLPPPAKAAFEAASGLVIETTDVLDPTIMATALLSRPDLTTLPAGQTLETLVPPDEMKQLAPQLEKRAMPLAAVQTLQPWFLATQLLVAPCEAARMKEGAKVLDLALAQDAKDSGKPVEGLEKATEQLEALASMPLDLQVDNLAATLDLVDELPDLFETMTDLYLSGRIALIEPATSALAPAGTDEARSIEVTQRFDEAVVDRRNAVMSERLQPLLTKGGLFVAVGALHLPGETGLVESLRRTGWTVTRAD